MSAFMCSNKHIVALVNKALDYDLGMYHGARGQAHPGQFLTDLLYNQNLKSILHRYPDEKAEHYAPAHFVHRPITLSPIAVIKLCDCYDYQACETEDYEQTEAAKFIRHIRSRAISKLPGYEEAPWGLD